MSHKENLKTSKKKVKPRRSWGELNPVTKVIDSRKKYERSREKQKFRRDFECEG